MCKNLYSERLGGPRLHQYRFKKVDSHMCAPGNLETAVLGHSAMPTIAQSIGIMSIRPRSERMRGIP